MFGPLADEISSTSICRGGLVEETYHAVRAWDIDATKEENLHLLRDSGTISARTESWRRDIISAISRRFDPAGRDRNLTVLAACGCSYEVWRPILLWHVTRNEFLVRDFLIRWLYPQYVEGAHRISADDLIPYLVQRRIQNKLRKPWQPPTLRRVANGLLKTASDFELLRGTVTREFEPYHLPEQAFLYILHAMAEAEPNARRIVDSEDWRTYFLGTTDVERELLRLHQFRKVHYEAAGSLAQLALPQATSADYARELCP